MSKREEGNYPTRDLFIETLVKLGGKYLIKSEVSSEFDIKFKFSECRFMANVTNSSYDIDICFPDWLHVDWDDNDTCAYVTKLVNDLNFGLKSKFFYTIHEEENLIRLHNSISFQLLSNIPNIEEYMSGKLNQLISEQQMFIQEMENLKEQMLLSNTECNQGEAN